MDSNLSKTKIFLIVILIIMCQVLFALILLDSNKPILSFYHKLGVKKYLKEENYDDEFTNVEFVEKNDYIQEISCDGARFEDKHGEYYRYKVHAQKANVDFYVQYYTKLSYEDCYLTDDCGIKKTVPGYEDDYIETVTDKKIVSKFQEVLGSDMEIQFRKDLNNPVLYRTHTDFLEIYTNKVLSDVYSDEFLNKLKKVNEVVSEKEVSTEVFSISFFFLDCELYIYERGSSGLDIEFRNNKEDTESLLKYQKNVTDWLYNNVEEYRKYIDDIETK